MFKDYRKEKLDKVLSRMFNGNTYNFNLTTNDNSTTVSVEDFLTLSQDEIDKQYIEFSNSVDEHNKMRSEIGTNNRKIKQDFLQAVEGIENINKFYKGRMKKKNGDLYVHWNKVIEDLLSYVPPSRSKQNSEETFDFTFNYSGQSYTIRTKIITVIEDITNKIKNLNQKALKQDEQYIKSLAYIEEHNVDSSWCVTKQDFYCCANSHAEELYRESMQDEEIDVTHGDGDDCEWTVGERRCNCGNNRYYLEVDGDFINGFYSYGQWY